MTTLNLDFTRGTIPESWLNCVGLDLETTMDHQTIHMVGFKTDRERGYSVEIDADYQREVIDSPGPLMAHNGVGFDYPVLKRVWGAESVPEKDLLDSMLLSQMRWPDHPQGHSLAAVASFVNMKKMEAPSFDVFTPEMVDYCLGDVDITKAVGEMALKLMKDANWSRGCIELEHRVAGIIREQERNGFRLDIPKTMKFKAHLEDEMAKIEKEVLDAFYPEIEAVQGTPKRDLHEVVDITTVSIIAARYGISVPFSKKNLWRVRPVNLSSRQQLNARLMFAGWQPNKYTEKSIEKYKHTGNRDDLTPILDEDTLSTSPVPQARLLARRFKLEKLLGYTTKWLELVEDDGRVRGRVFSIGAPTARMSHFKPNMAQIPAVGKEYGKECRECWIVEEGNVLTGVDASGLELRCLAHYVNDSEFSFEIVEGDIHTKNQVAMGLSNRNDAKTAIYAWLYGAGPGKLGNIAGEGAERGKKMKEGLLKRWPAVRQLIEKVERLSKKGYLPSIDGRDLYVRKSHAALNTLLQGCGAIIMKVALVVCDQSFKEAGLSYKFVANVHDEFQIEHHPDDSELIRELAKDSIRIAGELLGLRVPLAGEAKTGLNWAETH